MPNRSVDDQPDRDRPPKLAIDNLAGLAKALDTRVDELLTESSDDEVVIRPTRSAAGQGAVQWPL